MNDIAKKILREKLVEAQTKEHLVQHEAAKLLDIPQTYFSFIKTGTNIKAVPDKVWEKVQKWTNSGYSITEYPKHRDADPTANPDNTEITDVEFEGEPPSNVPEAVTAEAAPPIPGEMEVKPKAHLQSCGEFYHEMYKLRFGQLKEAIMASLNLNDALEPDWIEEYNDLYGKLEDYPG